MKRIAYPVLLPSVSACPASVGPYGWVPAHPKAAGAPRCQQ
jgi:hypothetical protein